MPAVAPTTKPKPRAPKLPRPKTIDDAIRYSFWKPAPGAYSPNDPGDLTNPKPGGRFPEARVPSTLDHFPRAKAYVPGPGTYQTPDLLDFQLPEGGRCNRQPPVERLQMDEYPMPAPGDYGIPNDPTKPRHLYGAFGKDPKFPAFIKEAEMQTKGNPAPGTYEQVEMNISDNTRGVPKPAKPFCPEGGKLGSSKLPSYFEVAPKRWEANPPPDRYDLPGAINPNKAVGRLTFKYQSATITETRSIVNKVSSHDTPGPGSYDIPDPPPIANAPTIKGRQLAHGMPAPYNYNCGPDLGRNYTTLAPVRQQNSGDQIYGNGFKRGAAPRFTGAAAKGSRPSSAGSSVKPKANVPDIGMAGTTALELNPEDAVQWRSGGFTSMRKSRSTPAVQQPPLHPVVEEYKKYYPTLAGKRSRKDFMPMAVRKPLGPVSTRDDSEEYASLQRGRMGLSVLSKHLEHASSTVLEPLDEKKLQRESLECLVDKARERMRREGVPINQQDEIISEMLGVLVDKGKKKAQPQMDAGQETFAGESLASVTEDQSQAEESRVNDIDRQDEVGERDFESYAEEVSEALAQGHEDVALRILDFMVNAQDGDQSDFPPFEVQHGDHTERIAVEMTIRRSSGVYTVAYKSRSSVIASTADTSGAAPSGAGASTDGLMASAGIGVDGATGDSRSRGSWT